MFERLPILSTLGGMLNRRDPRKQAEIALARLLSQFDMAAMPYETGVAQSRRGESSRSVTIGVWLVPISAGPIGEDTDMGHAIPAASCDLRRQGFGVLVPVQPKADRFIVAVGDMENAWRFFVTQVRHRSERPGGWFQIGLKVEIVFEPDTEQMKQFRTRIRTAFAEPENEDVMDTEQATEPEPEMEFALPLAE